MTNMETTPEFWKFGVTLATVCVPFFLLIGFLNTDSGYRIWAEKTKAIYRWLKPKPKAPQVEDDFAPALVNRTFSTEEGMRMRLGQSQGQGQGHGHRPEQTQRNSHPHIRRMVEAMGDGKPSGLVRMGTVQTDRTTLNGEAIAESNEEEDGQKEKGKSTSRDTVIDMRDE
jgi:hypothetical protein